MLYCRDYEKIFYESNVNSRFLPNFLLFIIYRKYDILILRYIKKYQQNKYKTETSVQSLLYSTLTYLQNNNKVDKKNTRYLYLRFNLECT